MVKDIILRLDEIGRKYYSSSPSGYVQYAYDSLTDKQYSDIRKLFGIHKDRDFKRNSLPSLMGHSGVLDLEQFPGEIVILDPDDEIFGLESNWKSEQQQRIEALITCEGAKHIYNKFPGKYAIIDITFGDYFRKGFANVYLKLRSPDDIDCDVNSNNENNYNSNNNNGNNNNGNNNNNNNNQDGGFRKKRKTRKSKKSKHRKTSKRRRSTH